MGGPCTLELRWPNPWFASSAIPTPNTGTRGRYLICCFSRHREMLQISASMRPTQRLASSCATVPLPTSPIACPKPNRNRYFQEPLPGDTHQILADGRIGSDRRKNLQVM